MVILRFKGLAIEKEDFEQKYGLTLTSIEWKSIQMKAQNQWEENIENIRSLAEKCTRDALISAGFKPELSDGKLKYKKV